MALVDIGKIWYPDMGVHEGVWGGAGSLSTIATDAADEKIALIAEIPETGNVVGVEVRTGTVTTGSTVLVRMETVDAATGNPTGTLYHANADGTAILITTTDANKIITDGFGGGTAWGTVPVTQGDIFAFILAQPSASSGACQLTGVRPTTPGQNAEAFPYTALFESSAWTKSSVPLSFALEYSGGIYHWINDKFFPFLLPVTIVYDNNDALKEYGAKITVDMKCRAAGVKIQADYDALSDLVITLYDSGGSQIATTPTIDDDIAFAQGGGDGGAWLVRRFVAPVEIAAGSTVYVGVKPQTTTAIDLNFWSTTSQAHLNAFPSRGKMIRVDRATQGSGAWNETTTQEPRISLLIDRLDDGAGGGGGGGGGMRLAGPGGLAA